MSNPNGAKGKAFERDTVAFLRLTFGRLVRRPHAEGFEDVGDIHLSPFVLQAKNYADVATALTAGIKGAEIQAVRAEEPFGVAVIKKRNAPIAEARVAMSLSTFRAVVRRLHSAEDHLAANHPATLREHFAALDKE